MENIVGYHKRGDNRRRTTTFNKDIYKAVNKKRYEELLKNDREVSFSEMVNRLIRKGLK